VTRTAQERRGIRDRYRAHVREEVKDAALEQLATGGPQALSINAIAKELGVSGPALYRYFAGRDELLTELVLDAHGDLEAALAAATAAHLRLSPAGRLRSWAHAYRRWALYQPHRYVLLHDPPVPGDGARSDRLVEAAHGAVAVLLDVLAGFDAADFPAPPDGLAATLQDWTARHGTAAAPAIAHHALVVWGRVHGVVDLELGGGYTAMGLDPTALFDTEVTALLP
jgi:AcrR family transcriptional regulator